MIPLVAKRYKRAGTASPLTGAAAASVVQQQVGISVENAVAGTIFTIPFDRDSFFDSKDRRAGRSRFVSFLRAPSRRRWAREVPPPRAARVRQARDDDRRSDRPLIENLQCDGRMTRCSDCCAEVPPDEPGSERQPCPNCGSLTRTHEASAAMTVGVSASVATTVERSLNETRLAVFGIIVGISLAVGFGVPGPWLAELGAAVASFSGGCLLIRWSRTRHLLMGFMHWLTDR